MLCLSDRHRTLELRRGGVLPSAPNGYFLRGLRSLSAKFPPCQATGKRSMTSKKRADGMRQGGSLGASQWPSGLRKIARASTVDVNDEGNVVRN
jgi:hypothetical protein